MKIRIVGWWFPVIVFPGIRLNNISEAEKLVGFLKEIGHLEEAEKVSLHIKEQIDGKYIKQEEYQVGEHDI